MYAGGPQAFTPEQYGATRNGKMIQDATIASAGTPCTVTSATQAQFTAADVGKTVILIPAAGAAGYVSTSITGVTNATTAQLATAPNTVTNATMIYGSDDTAAINSAITAAANYAVGDPNGNYGEVVFSSGLYLVAGALQTSQSGRAQIPLPNVSGTGQKSTIALRGICRDSSALPYWTQTTPQTSGPTIYSTLSMPAYSATLGSPSVIGGPTIEQIGSSNFSNLLVVIDGLSVAQGQNPGGCSVDLQGVAEANIGTLYCTGSNVPQYATNYGTWNGGVGLRMPQSGNNDNCNIQSYSCDGYTYGLIPNAHTNAFRLALLNCQYGMAVEYVNPNTMSVHYLSTEGCVYHLSCIAAAAGNQKGSLYISNWDIEDYSSTIPTTYHLNDASNLLQGEVHLHINNSNSGTTLDQQPLVNGATGVKIVDMISPRGKLPSPPSVPGSTSASAVVYRDCMVVLSCGSGGVSAISIGGNSTGLSGAASAVVTFMVPAGVSVAITYPSGSPSWTWWAL